jgi:hypothetical protein
MTSKVLKFKLELEDFIHFHRRSNYSNFQIHFHDSGSIGKICASGRFLRFLESGECLCHFFAVT